MDLICKDTFSETSSLYQNYSLVKVGLDGFIFHMASATTSTLYWCNSGADPSTWPTTFTK